MGFMKRAEAREEAARVGDKTHQVCVTFEQRQNWFCTFTDQGTGQQIGPTRRYRDAEVLTQIARRGRGLRNLDDTHALDFAISQGHGRLTLLLTEDQYRKLTA